MLRPPATRAEKIRVSKLGDKLSLYADAWDALSGNFATRTERRKVRDHHATLLGVEPRTLNNIAKPEFQRPERIKTIQTHYLAVADQKIAIVKAAISVIAGSETPEEAAVMAETTARTVYRRVSSILGLSQLETSDLNRMTNAQRTGLAQDIEATILNKLLKSREILKKKLDNPREIRKK